MLQYLTNVFFSVCSWFFTNWLSKSKTVAETQRVWKRPPYGCTKEKLSQKRDGLLSYATSNCSSYPFSLIHFSVSFSLSPSNDAPDATSPRRTEKLPEGEMHRVTKVRETASGPGSSWAANSCICENHMPWLSSYMFSCGLLLSLLETALQDRRTFGLMWYSPFHVHGRSLIWGTRVLLLWTDRLQKGQQSAHFTAGYQEPPFEWPSSLNWAWVNVKLWLPLPEVLWISSVFWKHSFRKGLISLEEVDY